MQLPKVKYGLLEFGSDETPSVIVGTGWAEVDREAARQIRDLYGDFIADERGGNFLEGHPYPDNDCHDDVVEWLKRLYNVTTEPLYTRLSDADVTVVPGETESSA